MKPEAIIICRTEVDASTFLGIALRVLGHSPSAAADASGRTMSDAARFISYLAAMRDPKAKVELSPKLLAHVSYSLLMVVDGVDVLPIMECASNMPFVSVETTMRNVWLLVITGTLLQWKTAVIAGSSLDVDSSVRFLFNKIQGLFQEEGVNPWTDYRQRQAPDQVTYLLEDKRGH